jgi:hypothetical protein
MGADKVNESSWGLFFLRPLVEERLSYVLMLSAVPRM